MINTANLERRAWPEMDLRQLRTLMRVAETGSITKASERLRVAQPALSRQMHALERVF